MGAICCVEKVKSNPEINTEGGETGNALLSPTEPEMIPTTSNASSKSTTRNAPGVDEPEDTKRLSVLLRPDLNQFNGYQQASTDSDEESSSDFDIPRGVVPDADIGEKRVPRAPRASISTRPDQNDLTVRRASLIAHEEGCLGWLDPQQVDDVFGTS